MVVNGRIQQYCCAVGEGGMHGTAVNPATLPTWQQQLHISKNRGNGHEFRHCQALIEKTPTR